jgi:hypothetical protein
MREQRERNQRRRGPPRGSEPTADDEKFLAAIANAFQSHPEVSAKYAITRLPATLDDLGIDRSNGPLVMQRRADTLVIGSSAVPTEADIGLTITSRAAPDARRHASAGDVGEGAPAGGI